MALPQEHRRRSVPVELDRLRWIAVVLPVAVILVIEGLRLGLVARDPSQQAGHVALAAMLLVGVITFSFVMFLGIEATQRHLVRQNHELAAVDAVSTAIQGELALEAVLDAALESVMASTGATEASIRVFGHGGERDGEPALERRRVAGPHASPMPVVGQTVPHLIDIPLSTGATVVGRMLLHLPEGADEPDLLATATLNNIGHQLASAIQIRQLLAGLQRQQNEDHRLYDVLLDVAEEGNLVEVLGVVVRDARELLGSEDAALCLSELGLRVLSDEDPKAAEAIAGPGFACIGDPPCISAQGHPRACLSRASVGDDSILSIPVRGPDGSAYGTLRLARPGTTFGDRESALLAALSDLASIAMTGARGREAGRQGAIVAERERIAREMHDSLAQVLGVTEIADLAALSEEAYRDVREAILGLREGSRAGRTLPESIAAYLARWGQQSGVDARLENEIPDEVPLTPRVEVQLIRVIQEALTNVRKHSGAAHVVVRLCGGDDCVRISVEDDGRGFDVGGTLLGRDGFGLHTMRERMGLVGGTLSIESAPRSGTKVVATVPALRTAVASPAR
jgi:signal transduction histidine kinase